MASRAPSPIKGKGGDDLQASSANNFDRRSGDFRRRSDPQPHRRGIGGLHIKRNVHAFLLHVASRITGTQQQQQQPGSPHGTNHSNHHRNAGSRKPGGRSHGAGQQAAIEESRRSLEKQFQQDTELARAAKESSGLAPYLTRADLSVHAYMALLSDLSNLVSCHPMSICVGLKHAFAHFMQFQAYYVDDPAWKVASSEKILQFDNWLESNRLSYVSCSESHQLGPVYD